MVPYSKFEWHCRNFLKSESDRGIIFEGLETLLSDVFMDKIWNMIYERYQVYENL